MPVPFGSQWMSFTFSTASWTCAERIAKIFYVECDEAKQIVIRHGVVRASVADVVGCRSGKGKRSTKAA